MRFNSPYQRRAPVVATDFLKRNGPMAALLPAIERMTALQKDCAAALPAMFRHCEILALEEDRLLLSAPNAAVAAKLKQQLPKLQELLQKKGWQINNIRLKVQMMKAVEIREPMRALSLPEMAVDSFAELSESLEQTAQNETLIRALQAMVRRRREE